MADPHATEKKQCRCNCGYTCGGPGTCDAAMDVCLREHFKRDCEHEFSGWEEGETPGGGYYGTTVCRHCGMTAMGHDCLVGP